MAASGTLWAEGCSSQDTSHAGSERSSPSSALATEQTACGIARAVHYWISHAYWCLVPLRWPVQRGSGGVGYQQKRRPFDLEDGAD